MVARKKIEDIVDEFLENDLCNIDYEHSYIQEQRALMIESLEELFKKEKI